ncbi:MAG: hypothetical protein CO186_10260 [Zetaproteobacteria bacterium CG_4_9_14_3_um_filter_49_83]|nr:MAG: hypothetical protein AUJ56_07335 [Zetaproteobacteria bacterium CG1_02_49_23]PIQ34484.1 MAG: hypothetical protein COW62_01365 [Zetaproteobacteria bacterium CG17_big_fil_post_rev_8_21_14_2_50_50_13]PIV29255.1 MAG: hypothetical protein COS35_13010 [Zetaproteobacteria bacterium CG02_land_8_20_14_3_00_50_9]PIY56089.1 MAG: hypothetical protein COZ00_06020 [Zetaproteobacteria bacterium CG_4_10_14_0_8_um_filter_49_80]PJA34529.1 MAG: hypothetical protein CO186_10260 [Zetaproteobacteria bacterium
MAEMSDLELLQELGVDTSTKKKAFRSPREERIIAGFEEIQRFVEKAGHAPEHGEGKDIFERLYAVRLDQIRKQSECRVLLMELDYQGLLGGSSFEVKEPEPGYAMDDAALLAQLGVDTPHEGDVTYLKHVKTRAEVRAAEEIASRTACKDFDNFKPIFKAVQEELNNGIRATQAFRDFAEIREGDLFILSGQKVYVAEVGELFINQNGKKDARLRIIYDNGTESDILLRSLQRALNKDETGRRIVETMPGSTAGPLFSGVSSDDDSASGTIYVLRSKSDNPIITKNRDVIHKIGVTGNNVERRIANAKIDPTFLMADVEIVATYELFNINRSKLENLIHKFFSAARLDIELKDRFGNPVVPREWFLVPLFVIDELVEKIKDRTISQYYYDIDKACLMQRH